MITREESEKNTLKLKVKLSADVWAKAVQDAYERTKGKYNIQGFRKGKAPRKVIEQTYGDTIFFEEAFDSAVSKEYGEFLNANTDLEPVSYPEVKINYVTVDGVEAELTVDLMPEIKLGAYEGLKVEKNVAEVKDADVDAEVQKLASSHARFVETEELAQMGDFATIDFVGSVDGVEFEGGKAEEYRLELGSHSFIDNFEEQVAGMKVGEGKDVKVKFPEGYPAKELAGKEAVFAVTVKKVEKKEIPEISDKFVADATEFETLAEYKDSVKAKLVDRAEAQAERQSENKLIEMIVETSEIDLPKSMVAHETDHLIEDLKNRLAYQGITLEQYLEFIKVSMDEFRNEKMKEGEKSLKTRLVLQQIIKDNNIQVTHDEIHEKIHEYAHMKGLSCEEAHAQMSDYERSYIENEVMMDKLFTFLKSKNSLN